LHRAIHKYGLSAFTVRVLQSVDSWAHAQALEQRFISDYATLAPGGYNMTLGGEGTVGYRHTDPARAEMSRKHKGRPVPDDVRQRMSATHLTLQKTPEHLAHIRAALAARPPLSPERLAKMQAAHVNGPLSEDHKKKIGDSLRGRKQDPAIVAARIPLVRAAMTLTVRQKIAASNRRRTVSDETRERMSKSLTVALARPEVKAKMAASNARRVWTAESRAKLGASRKGVPFSAEHREHMRQAAIAAHARRRAAKEGLTA
jgi:hypothetical protein